MKVIKQDIGRGEYRYNIVAEGDDFARDGALVVVKSVNGVLVIDAPSTRPRMDAAQAIEYAQALLAGVQIKDMLEAEREVEAELYLSTNGGTST